MRLPSIARACRGRLGRPASHHDDGRQRDRLRAILPPTVRPAPAVPRTSSPAPLRSRRSLASALLFRRSRRWYLIDRAGRRPILLWGAVVVCPLRRLATGVLSVQTDLLTRNGSFAATQMAIALFATGFFMALDVSFTRASPLATRPLLAASRTDPSPVRRPNPTPATAVVVCVISFNAAFGSSWGPVPWLYPAEVGPLAPCFRPGRLPTLTAAPHTVASDSADHATRFPGKGRLAFDRDKLVASPPSSPRQ